MPNPIQPIRDYSRARARQLAVWLDRKTASRLTPAMVTISGLVLHVPVALLIALEYNYWAAITLVLFGLFDTLDGALAKVQNRTSSRGMLLDATTDRFKEVFLYSGAAYALAAGDNPHVAVWAVVACGASLSVSYVKAKGEAAVAAHQKKIDHQILNRMFADGLMTFEVRMAVLVTGLLTGQLLWAVLVIAIASSYTAVSRLVRISRQL